MISMRRRWLLAVGIFGLLVLLLGACSNSVALLSIPPTPEAGMPKTASETSLRGVTTEEEQILIGLYQRVIPGVVNVQVLRRGPGNQAMGAAGSGFVFDQEGHIVTNAHVVRDADLIDVVLYDDTVVSATVVGLDDDSDLAVLKVELPARQLIPLPLGDSDAVVPGQRVVAIGNPFGQQGSMTVGIVSAVGRTIPSLTPFRIPQAIQTDAAINPGNSGGPLLNLRGEVIGVNAQIESVSRANSGVGFAIPSNIVKRVVPVLIEQGKFTWPWLGVQGVTLTPRIVRANGLAVTRGAYIVDVAASGPARAAGLRGATGRTMVEGLTVPVGGDVITAADGEPIRSMEDLIVYISQRQVGDRVVLTVFRDGKSVKIPVTLDARPTSG